MSSFRTDSVISYAAIIVTSMSVIGFCVESSAALIEFYSEADWPAVTDLIVGKSLIGFFLFSGAVYQLTRLGYLKRFARHRYGEVTGAF